MVRLEQFNALELTSAWLPTIGAECNIRPLPAAANSRPEPSDCEEKRDPGERDRHQGTCVKELFEDTDDLDAAIAPAGGGGLISGYCLTSFVITPDVAVYAAEPGQADDAYRSLKAGHIVAEDATKTSADGLKALLKDLT